MASRGSAHRKLIGQPLAGVIRAQSRRARSTTRRSGSVVGPQGVAGEPGAAGPEGPRGEAGPPGATPELLAATLVSDDQGLCTWTFDEPLQATPHVVAAVVAPVPVLVTVDASDETGVRLAVWNLDGTPAAEVDVTAVAVPGR